MIFLKALRVFFMKNTVIFFKLVVYPDSVFCMKQVKLINRLELNMIFHTEMTSHKDIALNQGTSSLYGTIQKN